jgi:hypothetical protein
MGTRGITKVIYKGETIVEQYGQWDHYPEGQGVTMFYTLQDPANVENFIKHIPQIYYPNQDELNALSKPFEDGSMDGMMTLDSGKLFSEKYPTLTRDTGAEIFRVIANWDDSPIPLVKDEGFENDELFCEGVYIVDLDQQLFTTKFGRHEGSWDIHLVLHFDTIREMKHQDEYIERCKDATLVR